MTLTRDTFRGISWMSALSVLTKGVAVGKIAILARLLTPAQFGSYGIALIVLGFLEVITETGINVFLIQEKDDIKTYLDSAWVVSIIRGSLVAALIIITAPWVLTFFRTPHISNLFYLVAMVAFIRGFINPSVVSFQKKLKFMQVFMFQGGLYVLDALIAVTLGFLLHSESALIISMVVTAGIETILSFALFTDRPKFKIDKEKFLRVLHAGKWITGAGVFSYIFQNIDNITVGRLLGTTSLGFYQQSYAVANLPVSGVGDVYNRVMFPIFVKIKDNKTELKKAFYKSLTAILVLAIVFGVLVNVFSHTIIVLFLGNKWLVVESTLKVLAVFGVLKSILNSSYSLFLSLKLQKVVMLSELFGIIGMAIAIYPMVLKYGTVGAALSAIIAVVCSFPVVILNVKKIFYTS